MVSDMPAQLDGISKQGMLALLIQAVRMRHLHNQGSGNKAHKGVSQSPRTWFIAGHLDVALTTPHSSACPVGPLPLGGAPNYPFS